MNDHIITNPEPDSVAPLDWLPTYVMVKLFDHEECRQLIRDAVASGKFATGLVVDDEGNNIEHDGRKVEILRLAGGTLFDQIKQRVLERLSEMNSRYEFDLYGSEDGLFNEVHILRYTKGGFHGNHLDLAPYNGMANRKLSLVCQLNVGYHGGDLVLFNASRDVPFSSDTVGYAAVYPSWIPHMVFEVEEGERFTLVIWLRGPRFR